MKFLALAFQKLSPEQIHRHIDSQIDTQQSTCEDGLVFVEIMNTTRNKNAFQ